jgi:hypothetical protein
MLKLAADAPAAIVSVFPCGDDDPAIAARHGISREEQTLCHQCINDPYYGSVVPDNEGYVIRNRP